MKLKIFPIFLIIIFVIIFVVFFKGLQNSNIYTPRLHIKKNIPIFNTKKFESNETINSKEIFLEKKILLIKHMVILVCSMQRGT